MTKIPKNMPFEFVLDLLYPLEVEIKPMFGCFSLYLDGKLILFLRDRDDDAYENGVWVAATNEGFESLASDLDLEIDGQAQSKKKWLKICSELGGFEPTVRRACELIRKGDARIGR